MKPRRLHKIPRKQIQWTEEEKALIESYAACIRKALAAVPSGARGPFGPITLTSDGDACKITIQGETE